MATRKKSASPRASKSTQSGNKSSAKGGKSAAPKRRLGKLAPNAKARGLEASEVAIAMDSPEVAALATLVREAGGEALVCPADVRDGEAMGRAAALGVVVLRHRLAQEGVALLRPVAPT